MGERGLFGRLRAGLQKTRQALRQNLESVFSRQRIDAETLEDLEEVLIMADLGVQVTHKVLQEVTNRVKEKTIDAADGWRDGVVATIRDILLAAT
ncbi:MAG: signal recognition particle receptor subunit alpha, partial [Candidatus Tectomicrobia bacterium]